MIDLSDAEPGDTAIRGIGLAVFGHGTKWISKAPPPKEGIYIGQLICNVGDNPNDWPGFADGRPWVFDGLHDPYE